MTMFQEFIGTYGVSILYSAVIAIAGFLGTAFKRLYEKYINDKTKHDVAKTCVGAIEQIYKDLHGEDKYNKCVEAMSEMLTVKGISITEFEIRMLIEAAVNEFNSSAKLSHIDAETK